MDWTQRRIDVPTEHMQNIFGGYDSYIRKIEDNLKVTIIDRDGAVKITGTERAVRRGGENVSQ